MADLDDHPFTAGKQLVSALPIQWQQGLDRPADCHFGLGMSDGRGPPSEREPAMTTPTTINATPVAHAALWWTGRCPATTVEPGSPATGR